MTAMASNDERDVPWDVPRDRDTSYETFLRVKNGISDAALRAAGLPPAQALTYDDYVATFGARRDQQDAALERLRGSPRAAEMAEPVPGPPPLGRRLVLDEGPDGSWRITGDADGRPYALPLLPQPRRYFAKTVAMMMGIACAFVLAAYINMAFLRSDMAAPVVAAGGTVAREPGQVPISLSEPGTSLPDNAAEMETATGGPDTSWSNAAPEPSPQPVANKQPGPSKTKPADLPNSTPTAAQQRLPNTTRPASVP